MTLDKHLSELEGWDSDSEREDRRPLSLAAPRQMSPNDHDSAPCQGLGGSRPSQVAPGSLYLSQGGTVQHRNQARHFQAESFSTRLRAPRGRGAATLPRSPAPGPQASPRVSARAALSRAGIHPRLRPNSREGLSRVPQPSSDEVPTPQKVTAFEKRVVTDRINQDEVTRE